MARKVLITFLGTGGIRNEDSRNYRKAIYFKDDFESETPFISAALIDYLNIDYVLMFGTLKSMWEAVYLHYTDEINIDQDFTYALFSSCENAKYSDLLSNEYITHLENKLGGNWNLNLIHYGISENEIQTNFEIFTKALNVLKHGDQIYLDITHSFRSLPLFATTAIDFINTVSNKDLQVNGIYYGMLEASAEFGNKAPIVELNYISELQKWIKGSYAFTKYGASDLLESLLRTDNKTIADKLNDFTDMLSMNFIHEVDSKLAVIKSLSKEFEKMSGPSALIIPQIFKQFIIYFRQAKKLSEYQFLLSKWHYKNSNFALSYLCLVEAIVTFVCEKECIEYLGEDNRNMAKKYIINNLKYTSVKEIFSPANKIRTSVTHLTGNKNIGAKQSIISLDKFIKDFEKIIF